jgi:uncharacterized protein YdhG (YjbR/CyaY superfamily)
LSSAAPRSDATRIETLAIALGLSKAAGVDRGAAGRHHVCMSDVDAYIAGFPPEVAARLQRVRELIRAEVPDAEERMRYGIAAVMLGGRYALHFAGWKKHIGLYPVPALPEPLETEVAPLRSGKDSLVLPHADPLPEQLISRIAHEIVRMRRPD